MEDIDYPMNQFLLLFCVWSGSCPDDLKVYRTDGRSRFLQAVSSGEILPRLQNRSVRVSQRPVAVFFFVYDVLSRYSLSPYKT